MEPDRCRRKCHKQNTEHLDHLECVLMVMSMIVAFVVLLWRVVRMHLVLVDVRRSFVSGGHEISWHFS
jgi:hypothetical protein